MSKKKSKNNGITSRSLRFYPLNKIQTWMNSQFKNIINKNQKAAEMSNACSLKIYIYIQGK